MVIATTIVFWASIGLILYAYVLYAFCLAAARRVIPIRVHQKGTQLPSVSIVIAAFNEEQSIRQRVENCLALDYPKDRLEIIVASDGSSDGTNKILSNVKSDLVRPLLFENRAGKVNVLNRAVPQAQNEILIFSDATSQFEPDILRKFVRHFADDSVGCVCGNVQFVNADGSRTAELEGPYWKLETFLRNREGERGCTLGATGAAFALRRKLWQACPSNAIVEDFIIPMRVLQQGYRVYFDPEALVVEEAASQVNEEFERRRRIGAGALQSFLFLLPMINPLRGFPAIAFISHKVLRWATPLLMITGLAANAALALESSFYQALFIPHFLFYSLASIGALLARSNRVMRVFSLPYYFVSMNTALLLGYIRYLRGTQKVTWNRVSR